MVSGTATPTATKKKMLASSNCIKPLDYSRDLPGTGSQVHERYSEMRWPGQGDHLLDGRTRKVRFGWLLLVASWARADASLPPAGHWSNACPRLDLEPPGDLVHGSFTVPGAREALTAVWEGSWHHNQWQVWLLRESDTGWQRVRKIAESCSGEIRSLSDGAVDLVLYEEACTHQGDSDGVIK